MLKLQLQKFINNKWKDNNVIFSIFALHLDKILDSNGRFSCSNYISNKVSLILDGKIDLSIYDKENLKVLEQEDFVEEDFSKLYISKVTLSGIKGFVNHEDYCRSSDKSTCSIQPVLNLKNRKSAVIFGWNGEGKSSITESIEYGLTNDVVEKKRRGMNNIAEYLLNVDSNSGFVEIELFKPYNPPKVVNIKRSISKGRKTSEVVISGDEVLRSEVLDKLSLYEEYFSKHFVERNRIENFVVSRGAENRETYGKLIGLDELNDFIKNSWKNYNSQCKEDVYLKYTKNQDKYKTLEEQMNKLADGMPEIRPIEIKEENVSLITESFDLTKDDIVTEEIESLYDKVTGELSKIDIIINAINDADEVLTEIDKYYSLVNKRDKVLESIADFDYVNNLYDFYTKSKNVINQGDNECPLCGETAKYGNALLTRVEEKLVELKERKNDFKELQNINIQIDKNKNLIGTKVENIFNEDYKKEEVVKDLLDHNLKDKLEEKRASDLEKIFKRKKMFEELKQYFAEIRGQIHLRKKIENDIVNIKTELKELESKVVEEKELNTLKDSILKDVKEFETELRTFYNEELSRELSDINADVKKYYNKFETQEPVENIELKQNDKEFKFFVQYKENSPQLDPLTVLSEGQLRCFGLAILLSISNKFKTNFIMLDDIVNAIDVEHRANIVKVLCEEMESPKSQQLIVTTHDKLFREKLINSVKNRNSILAFTFESKCIVIENTTDINFQEKIETSILRKDCRTALVFMRILLENVIYSMANGQVKVEFKDQVYKYNLEKVFQAVATHYPEMEAIYNYFIKNSNYLYWSILNQENHFWSEQGLCLDCELIEEIYTKIKCVISIKNYYSLSDAERNELKLQKQFDKPDMNKFASDSKVFRFDWFDEENNWTDSFKNFSEVI